MEQDALVQLLGRLHPLLLHMPIGLWFGVVALEFGGALVRRAPGRATLAILAWMAALGGAFAAGSGWILGTKGYHNDTIDLHRWLGVTAAAIGIVTASFGALQNRGAFRLLLVLEFITLMAAGHFGSEETHGKDWLTEPFRQTASGGEPSEATPDANKPSEPPVEPAATAAKPDPIAPVVRETTEQPEPKDPPKSEADAKHDPKPLFPPIEPRKPIVESARAANPSVAAQQAEEARDKSNQDAAPAPSAATGTEPKPATQGAQAAQGERVSFRAQVAPILGNYCISCHGETRKKGGLRLHTAAAILAGGENGAVVKKEDAANSPLHALLLLPEDDERHMPPSDKKQPTAIEIEVLRRWIEQGAKFDTVEPQAPAPAQPAAEGDSKQANAQPNTAPAAPWTDAAEASMRALHAQQIHVARIAEGSDDLWVDFGAVAATTTDEQACAQATTLAPWIADLSVARSGAAAATLAACATMPRLHRLDLRSTKLTSDHIKLLGAHASLQELVLADTAVDDACVDTLLAMPRLRRVYVWNTKIGERGVARLCLRHGLSVDVGETATATAPVAEASADKPAAAPKPRNTTCPVSGSPVDPKYAVWLEGRAIGFCCPNCPKTFWAEPAKYPVADR